ncbi:helix-turn-helix domain-containing protein [Streptomyces sp. SID8361]|uniref:IclR family transcriptional regulator n=1 Tax=Streptomyces sp. MnatMP-M27 TaxID=1839768 RepID=UPI00081F680D|nr:IclR family transcriptional regulator [Streptomyces sp. MnatMP-M27]MYU10939.1 helix-turn-helix domain-containing protein [Streptomyces sp. SID8361]SCF76714.1 transcriptional regulator, IclR family [Streptomyces sp. MnatMP-M27]
MRSTERDDGRNSVLGRAVAPLSAFHQDDEYVSLSELARRAGMPKPTAHRLSGQLIDLGMLETGSHGLRLGLRVFELGQLVPRQRGLRDAARPHLEDLHRTFGETVHLAVLQGADVVYLDKLTSRITPVAPSRIGGRMPAHATALGKALLAHADPQVRDAVLASPLERRTPRTIVMRGLLARELGRVRTEGIACEYEESAPGLVCVAHPVRDDSGRVIAAVSVSGRINRLRVDRVAPALRTAALTLARRYRSH